MGRFLDGVASICDVCHDAQYEGEAAIEPEELAKTEKSPVPAYAFSLTRTAEFTGESPMIFDGAPVLAECVRQLRSGVASSHIARPFT